MAKYLSGRSKKTPQSALASERYRYLSTAESEPDLGDPLVGPSSIGAKPVPPGQQYIIVAIGSSTGERFWIPNQGGLIPGAISIFDEGNLTPVGGLSSITQLNFKGAAVSAQGYLDQYGNPGVAATITVFAPGNNSEILFNTANDFSTSSKLTFDVSTGLLSAGDRLNVGAGGTVITTTGIGSVGIGTINPTQELDINGDLRLRGTIYDYTNSPGSSGQLLIKNSLGGVIWINASAIKSGAGGTIGQIQYHDSAGLVGGASNFYFDFINNRIGIGSTQPSVLLDVSGISSFKGRVDIDNLRVTGVATITTLNVTGLTTTEYLRVTGVATARTLIVTGLTTTEYLRVGVATITTLGVTGLTTTEYLRVGVTTIGTLGVTGLTTTRDLRVIGLATVSGTFLDVANDLKVSGISTLGGIKVQSTTISTPSGNLILDSNSGTTQITDKVFINDSTESTSIGNGSLYTLGGVGIAKNLNVGGLTSARDLLVTGITTVGFLTGTDAWFSGIVTAKEFKGSAFTLENNLKTKYLEVTGIATIVTLGVTGLTTTEYLRVGVATITTLGVTGILTTKDFVVTGITTIPSLNINTTGIGIGDLGSDGGPDSIFGIYNTSPAGTVSFSIKNGLGNPNSILVLTSSTATISGILTTNDLTVIGFTTTRDLRVGGIATVGTSLNVGGFTTTRDLRVIGIATILTLNVGGLTTTRDLRVIGVSTFEGNVDLGNDSTDRINFGGQVNTNVIPISGGTLDLGSPTNKWNTVYANTFSADVVSGKISVTDDSSTNDIRYLGFVTTFNGSSNLYADDSLVWKPNVNYLGIGTANPGEKLQVDGNIRVGISTTSNYIAFRGVYLDGVNSSGQDQSATIKAYTHTFIGERVYQSDGEKSELVLLKGNDANQNGPDRIRLIAPEIRLDTYEDSLLFHNLTPYNAFETISSSPSIQTRVTITTTGNLGIGTTTPGEKLQVDGNIRVGISTTSNYIVFRGTYLDDQIPYNHTYIGERIYVPGTERSELLLFKGNDYSTVNLGPDRIRLVGAELRFDTYTSNYVQGTFEQVATSVDVTNKLIITGDGNVGIGSTIPKAKLDVAGDIVPDQHNLRNLGSNSYKWNTVYATSFVGESISGTIAISDNTNTNATRYIPLVSSYNTPSSLYADSHLTYNPSTNTISIGSSAVIGSQNTHKLYAYTVDSFTPLDLRGRVISEAGASIIEETGSGPMLFKGSGTGQGGIQFYGVNWNPMARFYSGGSVTLYYDGYDRITTDNVGAAFSGTVYPTLNNQFDLGTNLLKWKNIYAAGDITATTFNGKFAGTADLAKKLETARTIGISGDLSWSVTFDGSTNVTSAGTLANTAVSPGSYGNSKNVASFTVDSKGRITSASNVAIDFGTANYAVNAGIATNLKGGTAYQIPYQKNANETEFIANGTAANQLLQYNVGAAPSWVNPSGLSVSKADYADNAGIATNLKGGGTYQIPYQKNANETSFIPTTGAAVGYLLQYGGTSAPSWVSPDNLTTGNLKGGNAGAIPYQSAVNATSFLLGNATNAGKILQSNGTAAPSWVSPTGLQGAVKRVSPPFFSNAPIISTDYTIGDSYPGGGYYNEMSIGPITINSGVTVTVVAGATWTIV